MSHSSLVTLISDQFITILGREVNMHDIGSIRVNNEGKIIDATINRSAQWLSKEAPQ